MSHPDDLLAPYVDGSLSPEERVVVDAHLAGCARCRDEVELAGVARSALAELRGPVEVPSRVGAAALEEARESRTAPGHPGWYRWIGAAAAAAAIVLAVAIAVPTLTGGEDGSGGSLAAEDAVSGGGGGAEDAPTVERIDGNLDANDLPGLAEPVRRAALGVDTGLEAPDATAELDGETGFAEASALPAAAGRHATAVECLYTAFPPVADTELRRLLEIRFEGTPAYAGVFFAAAGTGSGDATWEVDTLQVIVASRDGCALLSTAAVTS
jgi:hypothetical protein